MNYGKIIRDDIVNGPGFRTTLFVSGCPHQCKNCFNQETWDFNYGDKYSEKTEQIVLQSIAPSYIEGLTLLGGEPMHPANQKVLVHLIKSIKKKYPNKTIWVYTGYSFEDDILDSKGKARCESTDEILQNIDVIVDGKFVEELKNVNLRFKGSSNQKIIDVKNSMNGSIRYIG